MAQIDIEKKNQNNKKNNIGLYIIIAILVIAALYWWFSSDDGENELEVIAPAVMEHPLPKAPETDPMKETAEHNAFARLNIPQEVPST